MRGSQGCGFIRLLGSCLEFNCWAEYQSLAYNKSLPGHAKIACGILAVGKD